MAVIDTPEGIEAFRWLQLKHAVRLEGLGLRHSSGRSATAEAKRRLGLKRGASRETVLEAIEAKLEELR